MKTTEDLIKSARSMAERDPSLAVYILRDTREVKANKELSNLAWSMAMGYTTTREEALWFIELLEKAIKASSANESSD